MKEGDVVICINNISHERFLTINKKYKIIAIDEDKDYIQICDDFHEYYYYLTSRFKPGLLFERKEKLERISNEIKKIGIS